MAYAVYGTGGFAREVAPLLDANGSDIVFVDDREPRPASVNGRAVIDFATLCSPAHRLRKTVVAISDAAIRRSLEARLIASGLSIGMVTAGSSIIRDDVQVGAGSIIADFVVLTSNIHIGRSFHANLHSYVAHDCVIGDYVTFAPRVNCNGNVHIGDDVYVGTGASIIQGSPGEPLTIGSGAVIGMGSVVTKPVPPKTLVVGNPARAVRTLD